MRNRQTIVILVASAFVLFIGLVSLSSATINVGDDFNFQSAYRFLNASTSSVLGGLSVGTSTAQTPGAIYSTGNITSLGSFIGSLSAVNVSSGIFGSTAGKGNYTFQAAANTNPVLFVDASNERVGIGTSTPSAKLSVNGVLDMGNNKITSLGTPTANTDAATKAYVDASNPTWSYLYLYNTDSLNPTNGNIGGLSGADSRCQTYKPSYVPNNLTYKAYLCGGGVCQHPPAAGANTIVIGVPSLLTEVNFLYNHAGRYRVLNISNTTGLPANASCVVSNTLSHGVSDLYRPDLPSFNLSTGVWNSSWSGTNGLVAYTYNGANIYDQSTSDNSGKDCNNWTDGTAGSNGRLMNLGANFTDATTWIGYYNVACNQTYPLLCYAY
jgi:hypothetical protein